MAENEMVADNFNFVAWVIIFLIWSGAVGWYCYGMGYMRGQNFEIKKQISALSPETGK